MLKRIGAYPKVTLVMMALLVIGVGHRAAFITLDNRPETFFTADQGALETYHRFGRTFSADEVVLVDMDGASYRNEQDLLSLAALARDLEALEGVVGTLSIARIYDAALDGPLPDRLEPHVIADIETELETVESYGDLGLVRDGSMAVMATIDIDAADPAFRTNTVDEVERVATRFSTDRIETAVAGLAPTHAAFDRYTQRSLLLYMPAVLLVSIIVGLILFRSLGALLVMLTPTLGGVVLGVAGLEIAGQSLNLVTAVLPPLIMAIGFASSIHLVTHYGNVRQRNLDPQQAGLETIRDKVAPTSFAIATTAIGFGSLAISEVQSVRTLGISAAATLIVTLVLVVLMTPALLTWLRPSVHSPRHRRRLLQVLAEGALRHRLLVLGVSAAAFGVLLVGATHLQQSINGVRMLARNAPERIAFERLEGSGLGLANLELWIEMEVPTIEDLQAERTRLEALADEVERIPGVTGTFSSADLLAAADHRLERAEARGQSRREALASLSGNGELFELLSGTWSRRGGLRLTTLATTANRPEEIEIQREHILSTARELYPEAELTITGHYALLIGTPTALMDAFLSSLTATVLVVSLLFLVALRSFRLALAGLIANILPVAAVLGLMGWLGVSLDVASIMTGSVVFGLAVDDSFHYLYHRKVTGSLRRAAAIAGQGIVATTIVVTLGFATLGLSGFAPVMGFGLLTSFGALTALGIDALVLPALIGEEPNATVDRARQSAENLIPRGSRRALGPSS